MTMGELLVVNSNRVEQVLICILGAAIMSLGHFKRYVPVYRYKETGKCFALEYPIFKRR